MPGLLAHVGAVSTCSHLGAVTVQPNFPKVLVGGQPVVTTRDIHSVAGCPFTVGTKPQPCVIVRLEAATKVLVNQTPALLVTPTAMGYSAEQAPQGPANTSAVQKRVIAK